MADGKPGRVCNNSGCRAQGELQLLEVFDGGRSCRSCRERGQAYKAKKKVCSTDLLMLLSACPPVVPRSALRRWTARVLRSARSSGRDVHALCVAVGVSLVGEHALGLWLFVCHCLTVRLPLRYNCNLTIAAKLLQCSC